MMQIDGPAGPLTVDVTGEPAEGAIVCVHPINSAAVVWEPVAPLLGRPVVTLDLRGHGTSTMEGPFTVEEGYVPDVLAVLDALDLQRVHLVGGSLGGTICIALAAKLPARVASVTTFGSTLGTGVPAAAIDAMVAELTAKGTAGYFRELVPQVLGTAYRADTGILAAMAVAAGTRQEQVVAAILHGAFGADVRHLAGAVREAGIPVLAVAGTEDPTTPPGMSEELAERTGGRAGVLPGVGHLPMLEVPQRVAGLITENTA